MVRAAEDPAAEDREVLDARVEPVARRHRPLHMVRKKSWSSPVQKPEAPPEPNVAPDQGVAVQAAKAVVVSKAVPEIRNLISPVGGFSRI